MPFHSTFQLKWFSLYFHVQLWQRIFTQLRRLKLWVRSNFKGFLLPIPDYDDIPASLGNDQYILTELKYVSCSTVAIPSKNTEICSGAFCKYQYLYTDHFFQRTSTEISFEQATTDTWIEVAIRMCHQSFRNTFWMDNVPTSFSLNIAAEDSQRWRGTLWPVLLQFFYLQLILDSEIFQIVSW